MNTRRLDKYYLSERGVKYICDAKRGMCTDINPQICQTITAKDQTNWTGSFISKTIDHLEKSKTIGSTEPTKIYLKDGRVLTSDDDLSMLDARRMTPRECGRLMGFSDRDIDMVLAINSDSQAYHQFGNSIVENILVAIIGQMIEGKEDEYGKRA